MREKRTVQCSIFEAYAEHEIGRELKAMSDWLDRHLDLLDWVAADVRQRNVEQTGRKGLTVESVLRCAILKQYRQLRPHSGPNWLRTPPAAMAEIWTVAAPKLNSHAGRFAIKLPTFSICPQHGAAGRRVLGERQVMAVLQPVAPPPVNG